MSLIMCSCTNPNFGDSNKKVKGTFRVNKKLAVCYSCSFASICAAYKENICSIRSAQNSLVESVCKKLNIQILTEFGNCRPLSVFPRGRAQRRVFDDCCLIKVLWKTGGLPCLTLLSPEYVFPKSVKWR